MYQPLDTAWIDDSHPIPNLDVIDVHAVKKSGSRLVIVIASPLRADARSIFRLYSKLEGYLDYVGSPSHRQEHGPPTPQTTSIEVSLHAGADAEVLDLLTSLGDWVAKRGAALRVERR